MNKRRMAMLLALVMILAAALSACGSGSAEQSSQTPAAQSTAPSSTPSTPASSAPSTPSEPAKTEENRHYAVDADTVVVATADEAPSVTARKHNAAEAGYNNNLMYQGLMTMDANLAPQPCLAESFTYEDQADGSVLWTFNLRHGVKFHNGEEMTAKDVVASFAEAKESPDVATYAREYDNVTAVDDYTVTLTTPGPSAALLYDLCHHGNAICPADLIESGHDFNTDPIGTGPYKFVDWKISEQLEFTRFDDYWGEAPKIKNIIWKIIPEGSARTIALQAHEVDFVIALDTNDASLVEADDSLTSLVVSAVSHSWLTINNEKKPYDNKLVRKAMNAAINKEDVVTVAYNGYAIVAPGQTPYGQLGFDGTGYDFYDVELAKKYAEESGVDLNGVSLTVICSDDTKRRAGQVIQDNLNANLGMNVELTSMDLATYLSETAAGNFEGFIGGYNSSDMMSFLKGVYHSSNIGASNKTRTNDPHLDELIEKACATPDNDAREEILKETSRYLNELCCQIPLYQPKSLSAYNKYLGEIEKTASGRFWIEDWSWQ
ncbi:MAG: ABC transporter substrate-binding protein [Firmicutes bacterium]|nr:ABC transporter substrate-binding protein [Bacillota bacterium]MBQ3578860.1 ABC transporter substrate-binding protein [Bacillota bacterium]MBR0115161.1 ABC transporter substrate-binding protein [Bacillota bacterium]MBR0440895.1 ABC transporter substrate-binding protein [Bacillota bacterium]